MNLAQEKFDVNREMNRPLPTSQISHKKCLNLPNYGCCYLGEGQIRTADLLIRSQTLYPTTRPIPVFQICSKFD